MTKKHRVVQVGCGGRSNDHIRGRLANAGRFEIVALCDLDQEKMKETARARSIAPALYTDADRMLAETKPDLFCFSTHPDVRLAMVELAAKHKVKALAFEKPMARSLEEARQVTEICRLVASTIARAFSSWKDSARCGPRRRAGSTDRIGRPLGG